MMRLGIFVAFCRSVKMIRNRRRSSIFLQSTPHLIISREVFSSLYEINYFYCLSNIWTVVLFIFYTTLINYIQ